MNIQGCEPVREGGGADHLLPQADDWAIHMLDPEGLVSSWNAQARHLFGHDEAEILGKHFSCLHVREDRDAGLGQSALRIARLEGRFEGEGWRLRKDGSRFWAHGIIDPVLSQDGRLLGFVRIVRDLTERREAERTIRRNDEQFRLLVQSVTDYAIYMLDEKGNITSWNQGAQRIKGYLPSEIIGQHFSRFYTEADRAAGAPQQALATAAREGRFEKEGSRVRKDGSVFTAHVVIDPIRDPSGTLIGFAKVTRDITERKLAQTELEKAKEALFQAQKMDAVGQLTGGVAHDFNNLLMAILGSLELARKRLPSDPQLARLVDNAVQAARRGTTLTQRMLTFARRQALDPKALRLPDLVNAMVDMMERSLGPAVTIRTRFAPALAPVHADQNQLEMSLLNLAVNARDAMPEGGTIEICAENEVVGAGHETALAPGAYVKLVVRDDGEGMDAQTLARATEPFFTTKGAGKGTGLGLSMVHGMAEQLGGRFVLKSRKGEGTVAEIWLPQAIGQPVTQTGKPRADESRSHEKLRVLAVDDDALVLFNTVAMLEDLGHTVLEARSGREALEILRRQPVDLVVTDQAMPQMSGLQLLETIRKEWPALPVILATGYAELPGGVEKSLHKLSKPFSLAELGRAITRRFDKAPADA